MLGRVSFAIGVLICSWGPSFAEDEVELGRTAVIAGKNLTPRENRAVKMLVEEVHRRTGIHWLIVESSPPAGPAVTISLLPIRELSPSLDDLPRRPEAEGFTIRTNQRGSKIEIVGDERGILFGIGYLLRKMEMSPGKALLPGTINLTSNPSTKVRGHQLGYRPKTNSYDGWDLPQWEQYIRDLAIFGTNAIELVPPKSDDDEESPHFPRPKLEMMIGMSKLADDYGLDVWIWYPAIDGDYGDPKVVERSIREWGEVISKLPRVDAIFVPTGDPGNTRPILLMPLLQKQTEQLKRIHPNATMWISIQGLIKPWFDEMIGILSQEPPWLTGICYGPQTRYSLPELRRRLPARYLVRQYPDITHCIWCQYPVPDWDVAFAMTEGREPINPRPVDQTTIFRAFDDDTVGFITYSEGCNDDVNKFIWSGLGWDVNADPKEILRDYARVLIHPELADSFAEGLFRLEENWRGPVKENGGIPRTLAHFQALEEKANQSTRQNWRFQQALYRAYYDAFVHEKSQDSLEAWKRLKSLDLDSSEPVASKIERVTRDIESLKAKHLTSPLRSRVFSLADDLFKSIKMQLSVAKYQAIAVWRGANLDSIDVPLGDEDFLLTRLSAIQKLATDQEQRSALRELQQWSSPVPGTLLDDLGNPDAQPHLVRQPDFARDPASLQSSYIGFQPEPDLPRSWITYADGLFDVPVVLEYKNLDRSKSYRIRVVYTPQTRKYPVRLSTDDGVEIHPLIDRPVPARPVEFPIPREATADGELRLEFRGDPDRGGNGRGPQVAEVWLIPNP
jgi:hypothetical protein